MTHRVEQSVEHLLDIVCMPRLGKLLRVSLNSLKSGYIIPHFLNPVDSTLFSKFSAEQYLRSCFYAAIGMNVVRFERKARMFPH